MNEIIHHQRKFYDKVNPDVLTVSHSSMSVWQSCKRKFELRKLYKHGAFRSEFPMDIGKVMHLAYQHWLVHKDIDSALFVLLQKYPTEYAEFWDTKDYRSLEAVAVTMEAIFASQDMIEWELATIMDKHGQERPCVEVEFEIILDGFDILGRKIIYVGYIDAVLFNVLTGAYKCVDLKSNRAQSLERDANYRYDGQQLPYGFVLNHIVHGVLNTFQVTYLDAYIDILEPRVKTFSYDKTKQDVEEWFTAFCFQLLEIKRYAELGWFPRKQTGCLEYGKPCQFLMPCAERDFFKLQEYFLMALEEERPEQERNPVISLTLQFPQELLHL